MIRALLLLAILFVGWSSPAFRFAASKALRITADRIEPKEALEKAKNPRFFQIPNPFYDDSVE